MSAAKSFSFFIAPVLNKIPHCKMTLADAYAYITSQTARASTCQLRQEKNKDKAKDYKMTHFNFCTFSGEFERREGKDLIMHSGLLCLDFDHIAEVDSFKQKLISDPHFVTRLAFQSPSGDGLKWVIDIQPDNIVSHEDWYSAVSNYIEATYHIKADPACKDVTRACFLPYDPDAYIYNDETQNTSTSFYPSEWASAKNPGATIARIQIDTLIKRIERSGKDLTNNYEKWLKVGFALAHEMGEEGRQYYHRLSNRYPNYTPDETDKQYDKCLASKGDGITIRTLLFYASKEGFHLLKSAQNSETSNSAKRIDTDCKVDQETPPDEVIKVFKEIEETNQKRITSEAISDKIDRDTLPKLLKTICSYANSPSDYDLLLLGSLICFSACLPNICGVYARRISYANLFGFIISFASGGKGRLTLCKNLIMPIHNRMMEEYERKYRQYMRELNASGKKPITEEGDSLEAPALKVLLIPANNSASGVYRQLHDNNGSGLIFESEGDTLSQAFHSDFGDFSDGLRKAFHHEQISYNRRKNNEYIQVNEPRLSLLLSGTPLQVLSLIPNIENGLFSRFIFYHLDAEIKWNNVFDGDTLDDVFLDLGKDFLKLYDRLNKLKHPISFHFSEEQNDEFNLMFEKLQTEYFETFGNGILATVRRKGLITFRIAMILSALRLRDEETLPTQICCSDEDFKSATTIARLLLTHDISLINRFPKILTYTPILFKVQKQQLLYESIPHEFDKQEWNRCVKDLYINIKTAERYLKAWCEKGILTHVKQGYYQKSKITKGNEKSI